MTPWPGEHDEHREFIAEQDRALGELLPHCNPATPVDYAQWLTVYANAGHPLGRATQQNMGWDLQRWYVLIDHPGRIPALFGSAAVHVIVPPTVGLRWHEVRDIGHSTAYLFDPPWTNAFRSPEVYADVMKVLAMEHGMTVELLVAMAGPGAPAGCQP